MVFQWARRKRRILDAVIDSVTLSWAFASLPVTWQSPVPPAQLPQGIWVPAVSTAARDL